MTHVEENVAPSRLCVDSGHHSAVSVGTTFSLTPVSRQKDSHVDGSRRAGYPLQLVHFSPTLTSVASAFVWPHSIPFYLSRRQLDCTESKPILGLEIPNRPAGQRPETALPEANNFQNFGLAHMGGLRPKQQFNGLVRGFSDATAYGTTLALTVSIFSRLGSISILLSEKKKPFPNVVVMTVKQKCVL
ncbi:hypothetical protein RJ639_001859 [Escallonia herrerae]|uniref:Uncharacterized protein n=1 Tax=Escallonia herrerae TaxID=1293975 RepID=A0AA88X9T2_9ASTE|nr:hypothetical protein RJ639_001859 [Escallonia herrerae]